MLPYTKTSLIVLSTIFITFFIVYFIPDYENPYLNIFIKGFIITILFIFSTLKFKLAEEITAKIPFLKSIKL
jgi:hypothetical protein